MYNENQVGHDGGLKEEGPGRILVMNVKKKMRAEPRSIYEWGKKTLKRSYDQDLC